MSRKMMFLSAALLMATNGVICRAQVEQGAITGAVLDATGASIPKAKVTATNEATGTVATAETTDDGYYKLPYLLAGKYSLTVEKAGFATNKVTDVPVLVGNASKLVTATGWSPRHTLADTLTDMLTAARASLG